MAKNKGFKKAESSDLKLDVDLQKPDKELQRTEKWKEERRGRWTGSQLKNLMTCDQGAGKMSWDNLDKVFRFGKTSLKYIYENAKERETGRYIDQGDGTLQMRYGTIVEPLISKAAKKKLKKYGKMKDVGFKTFPTMPNAGVSSDKIIVNKKGKCIASVEMKACTNWQTHYERTFDSVDEKSTDFWQMQGQMIAWEVDTCYYVVAEPPQDIMKYVFYNGDIMDLYKDFLKECPVSIVKVPAQKLHQDALLKRICMAEQALNDWLSAGGNLKKVLDKTIEYFHENPKDLNKYILPLGLQDAKKLTKKVLDKNPKPGEFDKIKKQIIEKHRKKIKIKNKKSKS